MPRPLSFVPSIPLPVNCTVKDEGIGLRGCTYSSGLSGSEMTVQHPQHLMTRHLLAQQQLSLCFTYPKSPVSQIPPPEQAPLKKSWDKSVHLCSLLLMTQNRSDLIYPHVPGACAGH